MEKIVNSARLLMLMNALLVLEAVTYQEQSACLAVLLALLVLDQQTIVLNVSPDQSLKLEFAQAASRIVMHAL